MVQRKLNSVLNSRLLAAAIIAVSTASNSYAACASHAERAAALARQLYINNQNWLQTKANIDAAETDAEKDQLESVQSTNVDKYNETISDIIKRGKLIFDECASE